MLTTSVLVCVVMMGMMGVEGQRMMRRRQWEEDIPACAPSQNADPPPLVGVLPRMLTTSVLVCVVMMGMMGVEGQRMMRRRQWEEDIPACAPYVFQEKNEDDRSQEECPQRAVCADEWNTIRDWYNGTRCRDHRISYNCRCPNGHMCPIDNPDHRLYGNDKQSQYTCQPACALNRCLTDRFPAKEMVSTRRNRYYRINCRCLNHHVVLPSAGRRGANRATKYLRLFFDRQHGQVFTQYICLNLVPEDQDPCEGLQ
ncbi:hypothetical protein ACOMHN_018945 [Nucella lapillus]